METTDDTALGGKLKLLQPRDGHRAGHDAILLAAAAPKSHHALDLGAGVGTAGLALLARGRAKRVTLVEIDPRLSELSLENARRNGFADVVTAVCGDVTTGLPLQNDACDLVIMNPPFNDATAMRTSPDTAKAKAHVAEPATFERWIACAIRHLKSNGTLVAIHRPDSTLPILKSLDGRFGAIEIIPVYPKPDTEAIRVIVRAIKGRKTPSTLQPGFILNDASGKPSAQAEAILRDGAPLLTD